MIRLVVLLALVIAVWMVASWVLDAVRKSLEQSGSRRAESRRPGPERLVACDQCGSYVPSTRMITTLSGQSFCSDRCRRAHEAASPGTQSSPDGSPGTPEPPA